eukprot:scaffold81672_cov52-Phaeocystis_antarctica.AAC.2
MASLDEELPVTETAAHGIARSRGLHTRADSVQLLLDLLAPPVAAATAPAAAAPAAAPHWRDKPASWEVPLEGQPGGPTRRTKQLAQSSSLQRLGRVTIGLQRASVAALPSSPMQRRLQRGGAVKNLLAPPPLSLNSIDPARRAQAGRVCTGLLQVSGDELHMLQATPPQLAAGGEQQTRALAKRLQGLEQLQLHIQGGEAEAARGAVATLLAQLRADAARVFSFATQGVHVHGAVALPRFEPAESQLSGARFGPMWGRVRALLVAAEKVAQVSHLVRDGRRKALQEGVELLVSLEEDDLPSLFAIAREVVRAHDDARAEAAAAEETDDNVPPRPAPPPSRTAPPRSIVWWQQLHDEDDDEEEGHGGVHTIESWVATRDLGRARLCLLKGQVTEAISGLDQLRTDFIMFARSAAP